MAEFNRKPQLQCYMATDWKYNPQLRTLDDHEDRVEIPTPAIAAHMLSALHAKGELNCNNPMHRDLIDIAGDNLSPFVAQEIITWGSYMPSNVVPLTQAESDERYELGAD